mmetsp:Transcript_66577/g.157161  ORF Transcript_66577/g.157161 Transcript_66577/m.157161 type:complete len:201 (-) Transcript_66577:459-1061(-)
MHSSAVNAPTPPFASNQAATCLSSAIDSSMRAMCRMKTCPFCFTMSEYSSWKWMAGASSITTPPRGMNSAFMMAAPRAANNSLAHDMIRACSAKGNTPRSVAVTLPSPAPRSKAKTSGALRSRRPGFTAVSDVLIDITTPSCEGCGERVWARQLPAWGNEAHSRRRKASAASGLQTSPMSREGRTWGRHGVLSVISSRTA